MELEHCFEFRNFHLIRSEDAQSLDTLTDDPVDKIDHAQPPAELVALPIHLSATLPAVFAVAMSITPNLDDTHASSAVHYSLNRLACALRASWLAMSTSFSCFMGPPRTNRMMEEITRSFQLIAWLVSRTA